MAYLIDASSLIEAKNRYYAFDFHPGFWDWLDRGTETDIVCSIDRVRSELTDRGDELSDWADVRASTFFRPTDSAALDEYRRIIDWLAKSHYTQQAFSKFASGADPFLIAFAIAHSHTVVTEERPEPGKPSRIKIPDVCGQFSVPWINAFGMLRAAGAQFIVAP